MIKKIRLMFDARAYPVWIYNENNEIIDNDFPPEWRDDKELEKHFDAVHEIYQSFFIDNIHEFRYVGCQSEEDRQKLIACYGRALRLLLEKNQGKYEIVDEITDEIPHLHKAGEVDIFELLRLMNMTWDDYANNGYRVFR